MVTICWACISTVAAVVCLVGWTVTTMNLRKAEGLVHYWHEHWRHAHDGRNRADAKGREVGRERVGTMAAKKLNTIRAVLDGEDER